MDGNGPGNVIATMRHRRGLSLQQLADRIGCAKSQLSKLENGHRRLDDVWLQRIAEALQMTPNDLLAVRTSQTPAPSEPWPHDDADRSMMRNEFIVEESDDPQTLPVCGHGRFGLPSGYGLFVSPADAPERTWRPHPLSRIAGAYAVRMPDACLAPKFLANQMLFINPFRAPSVGAFVVVRQRDGLFIVAQLMELTAQGITLRFLNPARTIAVERTAIVAVETILASEEP